MLKQFTPETLLSVAYALNEIGGPEYCSAYPGQLRRVVKSFDDSLGRLATLGDLTAENLTKFKAYLAERIEPKTVQNYSGMIFRIWGHMRQIARDAVAMPPYKIKTDAIKAELPQLPSDPKKAAKLLEGYFLHIYAPRKLLGKAPRTLSMYRLTFDRFGEYLGHRPLVADLTDANLCGFLQHRIDQGRAPHTVDKERSKLLAIANYAAKKRAIPEFVDIPTLNPAKSAPQCWRIEQVQQLLAAARACEGNIGTAPARLYWESLVLVFLYTGERTGATLALRWEWLTRDGWLRVPAEVRKGGKKAMSYRLPSEALEAVERLRQYTGGSGIIFNMPWSKGVKSGTFYLRFGKLLRSAGLPDGRKFKPQMLRRTFASFLEAAGGDATRALAHSSRRVTENSYLDECVIDRTPSSSFVEKAFSPLFGKGGAA